MKDKAQEQQRLNEIMPRFAPDQAEQLDQTSAWEEFANIEVSPRRSPWSTPGSDDDDLLAQVSDKKVVVTSGTVQSAAQAQQPTTGLKTSIRLLTRVYVSGGNLLAEYTTYQIDAIRGTKSTEIVAEGAEC
jgi:hypothetical protein